MADDARRMGVVDEIARVVGRVGPACAGTGVGEGGFASAGAATEQDSATISADTCGVEVSDNG